MTEYSLVKVHEELAEIDRKLAGYQELIQRRQDLQQLRMLLLRLDGIEAKADKKESHAPPLSALPPPDRWTHSDHLQAALRKNGPLPITQLLIAVRGNGWQGSGDDAIDKRRLYVPLYREKEKFRLSEDGKWTLVQP